MNGGSGVGGGGVCVCVWGGGTIRNTRRDKVYASI